MAGRCPAMEHSPVTSSAAASGSSTSTVVVAPGVVPVQYLECSHCERKACMMIKLRAENASLRAELAETNANFEALAAQLQRLERAMANLDDLPPKKQKVQDAAPQPSAAASSPKAPTTKLAKGPAVAKPGARKCPPPAKPSPPTAAALLSALAAPPPKSSSSSTKPATSSASTPAATPGVAQSATPPAQSRSAAPPRPKKRKAACATPPPKRSPPVVQTGNRFDVLDSAATDLPPTDEDDVTDDAAATTGGRSSSSAPPTTKKPPAIHIRTKDDWLDIHRLLECAGIEVLKAKTLATSIRIQVADAAAHRATTKKLRELDVPFHTYTLPEDKLIRVVIRGVPEGIPASNVAVLLDDEGYPVESAARITRRGSKEPLPLVLVQLRREDRAYEIMNMTRFMNLVVSVEPQRRNNRITQCFRCQQFAHTARNCYAPPRCVKCAEAHLTHECQTPRATPARCVNCSGAHPASYRGCPKFPVLRQPSARKLPTRTPGRPSQPGVTYAAAARSATTSSDSATKITVPPQSAPPPPRFSDLLTSVNSDELLRSMKTMSEKLTKASSDTDRLMVVAAAFAALSGAPQ